MSNSTSFGLNSILASPSRRPTGSRDAWKNLSAQKKLAKPDFTGGLGTEEATSSSEPLKTPNEQPTTGLPEVTHMLNLSELDNEDVSQETSATGGNDKGQRKRGSVRCKIAYTD